MALYSDPPHTKHVPKVLPETQLPVAILTSADRPRIEPLWCERHALRMRNRNGLQGSMVRSNNAGPLQCSFQGGTVEVATVLYTAA